MRRYLTYAVWGAVFCIPAAGQKPTPEQQRQTLDTAREIAIHYASKLPNFICHEQVERTDQLQRTGQLSTIFHSDHLIIQLSYAGQKENYKLVSINGSPTTQPLSSLDGIITGGEFGSLQLGLFDPSSATDFQWKEATTLRKLLCASCGRPLTRMTFRRRPESPHLRYKRIMTSSTSRAASTCCPRIPIRAWSTATAKSAIW
jgi:hypothetical protein